ncbi:alpha/beta fold hydrolase [Methylobacterium oryzae CBMB20]
MLANFDYPHEDPTFAAELDRELTEFLDWTQTAPSLCVLCGGSEVWQQAAMLGAPRAVWAGAFCAETLPERVAAQRPDLVVVPNSPSGGDLPFSPRGGCTHYFGVGAYCRPLEDARRAEVGFASECLAFANPPEPGTPGPTGPADPLWPAGIPQDRGADWDFETVRDHYVGALYGVDPAALRAEDPDRYLELGRAAVAEVMEATFAEWRRPRSPTAGGLVLMLRDLAPGAGWGVIDWTHRPKSAWYALKRAFRPVQVLLTDEGLDGLHVHVLNETASVRALTLSLTFCDGAGRVAARAERDLVAGPRAALTLTSAALLGRFFDATDSYRFGPRIHDLAHARLTDADGCVVAESFHFPGARPVDRSAIGLRAEPVATGEGPGLRVSTERFARGVQVLAPGRGRPTAASTSRRGRAGSSPSRRPPGSRAGACGRSTAARSWNSVMTVEVGSEAAVPVTFEGLFGWFHPAAGTRGVVLCGAYGFEQMAAHRPWRALAEGLAAAGCPTLRFDYPGEGDSADPGEARVDDCVAAVRRAIGYLRATAGVTEIAVVGLRLGATFAALAGQDEAVARLVLLAPVTTGRAYLREMRLRAQTIGRLPDGSAPAQDPDSLTVGGFRMEAAFLADLADLNLARLGRAPAGHALLLAAETKALAARLGALGCDVATGGFPGLAALVADPIFSDVPTADFARVIGFATDGMPAARPRSGGLVAADAHPSGLTGPGWAEEPVRFGRGLLGIRCRPRRVEGAAPTILFVSTGMSVHSGWGRQTTDLARRLAAKGIASVRFDLRGIGDSDDRPDGRKPLFAADGFADVAAAIDLIAGAGGPILLVGGCSGAYAAFHALCRDRRVDGALLLNLYCFDWDPDQDLDQVIRQTFGSASTYAALLKRGATWRRLIRGEIRIAAIAAVLARRGIEAATSPDPPGSSPRAARRLTRPAGRRAASPGRRDPPALQRRRSRARGRPSPSRTLARDSGPAPRRARDGGAGRGPQFRIPRGPGPRRRGAAGSPPVRPPRARDARRRWGGRRAPSQSHPGGPDVTRLTRRSALAMAAGALAAGRAAAAQPLHRCEALIDSIGVNVHLGHRGSPYVDRFAACAEALDALGIRHLRDDIVLTGDEPAGQFERIADLADRGYRFSLIFYDGLTPGPRVPPERFAEIAAWAGDGLLVAEGGNEPPVAARPGLARLSADHQAALFRAVRADARAGVVRVAGPSYIQGNVAAAQNLAAFVDLANIHAYPGAEHPETEGAGSLARFVAAARPVFGDAPVIATENGYHTALATGSAHLPISPGLRARYLPRMLLWSYLQGVRRTYLYELISSFDRGDADPESRFGLLAHDGRPTPAFAAVRNLIRLFGAPAGESAAVPADRDVALAGPVPDLVTARFARLDGATLVPLWLAIDGWDRRSRALRPDVPARTAEFRLSRQPRRVRLHRFDDDGAVSAVDLPADRRVPLPVTDRLCVVELT